jgi:hypothetical protein
VIEVTWDFLVLALILVQVTLEEEMIESWKDIHQLHLEYVLIYKYFAL